MAALYAVFMVAREDLLALDARRRVYQQVADYPGLHLTELARNTGLAVNHAKYHLEHLEKHGLVSSRSEDGYRRFWPREESRVGPRETIGADEKRLLALMRRPVPLRIVLELLERGEASQVALLERVGVAQSTLSYHLGKLVKAGVLLVEPSGRERIYRLREPDRALGLLMRYRPPDRLVAGFLEAWEGFEV